MSTVACEELELTLLMPCLNEAETLESCICKAKRALDALQIPGEVLIADNGSTDGSIEIAQSCGARIVHVVEKGYGSALRAGIAHARGRYIVMGDADDSYDWSQMGPFYERLAAGEELVMGCRLPMGGGTIRPGAMPFLHRWLGNPVLSFIGRLFFKCAVTDFHCGLRGFSAQAIRRLNLQAHGMEFASEMIAKAGLSRLRISEVPITLHPAGRTRPPHLRTWRDGWRHLRFMLMFCPKWLFFIPGLVMVLFGLLNFICVLPGPLMIGAVGFDVNTLLIGSFVGLVGFQCMSFGFFARIYGLAEGVAPRDPLLDRILSFFTLERGLIAGVILLLTGGGLLFRALLYWGAHDFGALSYPVGLRMVIPAVTLAALGVQTLFLSFFLNILGVKNRQRA